MKNASIIFRTSLVLLFCLTISACNLSKSTGNIDSITNQQTSVAQTVAVLQTQMLMNTTPVVPVNPTITPMTLPTETLIPGPTIQSVTVTPGPGASPTYKIGSVVDVTYKDNTVVKPNETFTKTWKLTNGGTGTWTANFKLYFVSGDAMSGPASKAIGKAVAPGESVDVSIELKAPATPKTYQGKYMLQTESGQSFGLGANANGTFWVLVKVADNFVITSAVPVVSPTSHNAACPVNLVFTANITSTGTGKATYYFIISGVNSPTFELVFTAPGTLTTGTYTVPVNTSQTVTASIYIDHPNHQEFGTVLSIPVNCTP